MTEKSTYVYLFHMKNNILNEIVPIFLGIQYTLNIIKLTILGTVNIQRCFTMFLNKRMPTFWKSYRFYI